MRLGSGSLRSLLGAGRRPDMVPRLWSFGWSGAPASEIAMHALSLCMHATCAPFLASRGGLRISHLLARVTPRWILGIFIVHFMQALLYMQCMHVCRTLGDVVRVLCSRGAMSWRHAFQRSPCLLFLRTHPSRPGSPACILSHQGVTCCDLV